jgi:hypothetical protein
MIETVQVRVCQSYPYLSNLSVLILKVRFTYPTYQYLSLIILSYPCYVSSTFPKSRISTVDLQGYKEITHVIRVLWKILDDRIMQISLEKSGLTQG